MPALLDTLLSTTSAAAKAASDLGTADAPDSPAGLTNFARMAGGFSLHVLARPLRPYPRTVAGAHRAVFRQNDGDQPVDLDKRPRGCRPVASAHNAATDSYGTAGSRDTWREQQKQPEAGWQAQDGIQRRFEFDWRHGAAVSPPS